MEMEEDFAFECILQPSILDEKLLNKSPNDKNIVNLAFKVLRELLGQLSSVTKSHLATSADGQLGSNDTGSLKKKAYIQLMVLRISSFLSWDISDLNDSPALQLLLLETLLTVTDQYGTTIEENGSVIIHHETIKAKKFAFIVYHRWVLRTLPL